MAWTTPGTAVAGDVLTAAFWNEQVRDNMKEVAPFFGAVQTDWSPVLRTGNTPVTIGSGGQQVGRYIKIGRLVVGSAYILFGTSGVTVPAGFMDLQDLPATPDGLAEANVGIGQVWARNWTAGNIADTYLGIIGAPRNIYSEGAGNVVWAQTVPFTWGASDEIRINFCYIATV